MTSTFLVTLDVDAIDSQSLATTATDIQDALDSEFEVVEVKPWSRPTQEPGGLLSTPTMPLTGA